MYDIFIIFSGRVKLIPTSVHTKVDRIRDFLLVGFMTPVVGVEVILNKVLNKPRFGINWHGP